MIVIYDLPISFFGNTPINFILLHIGKTGHGRRPLSNIHLLQVLVSHSTFHTQTSGEQRKNPGCLGYMGIILPSYIGTI